MDGQRLARIDEPRMVDVELRAARQRRVRQAALDVMAQRRVRLVGAQVRRLHRRERRDAPVREPHVALLAERVDARAGRQRARLHRVQHHLLQHALRRLERAVRREVRPEVVETVRGAPAVCVFDEAARLRPLFDLARQVGEHLPLRARLARRRHARVREREIERLRRRLREAGLLVRRGSRQQDVRLERARRYTPVHADEQFQPVEDRRVRTASAAHPARPVRADLEQHARRMLRPRPGQSAPPALLDGLADVLPERLPHARIRPLPMRPSLGLRGVVVPEKRRYGAVAVASAALLQLDRRGRIRETRVVLLHAVDDGAAHVQDGAEDLAAGHRLHREEERTVEHARDGDADAGALLAPVAGEREQQAHRSLHQVAVVVLRGVEAEQHRRPLRCDLPRQQPDRVGMHAADRRRIFGRVARQAIAQQVEHRPHLDALAARDRRCERAFERGLRIRLEGFARGRRDGAAGPRPHIELVGAATLFDVGAAQEPAGVAAHEQRQVGLGPQERLVHQPFVDDGARHGERQRGIGAGTHAGVVVRVHRRRAVVGRNRHHLGAAIARFGDVVVVRDGGVDGIAVPDEQQVAVEPVVEAAGGGRLPERQIRPDAEVADVAVGVGARPADAVDQLFEEEARGESALARRARLDNRLGPRLLYRIDHRVGDLRERVVP